MFCTPTDNKINNLNESFSSLFSYFEFKSNLRNIPTYCNYFIS
jgi:hypothetical protein